MTKQGSRRARRQVVLLFAAMAVALLFSSGVALAIGTECGSNPCYGTAGVDYLYGSTSQPEVINLLGGNDHATGGEGQDAIFGGGGKDDLDGQEGNDRVYGGPSDDVILRGGEGADRIYGGSGNDVISAVPPKPTPDEDPDEGPPAAVESVDRSYGGTGNDSISAVDGYRDVIDCGPGKSDRVYYDWGKDTIKGCEIRPTIPRL